MLRKRSRPFQRDSSFSSDHVVHKARGSPFFSVSGLFVGLASKTGSSDSDYAKSPTSPLDCSIFANLGSSFAKSPRSPGFDAQPKSWDCDRVGLGLVDSLNNGKILGSSETKSILFGSQLRIQASAAKTHLDPLKDEQVSSQDQLDSPISPSASPQAPLLKSKSNSEVLFSQLSSNFSGSLPIPIMGSLSSSGIELSEDYTCIISHGPNPKTTHIFGDCILDGESIRSLENAVLPRDDFLSYCFSCKKKLEQGEDIYIYGGDKAFCSGNCRDKEILCEEETEKTATDDASADHLGSSFHDEIFIGLCS